MNLCRFVRHFRLQLLDLGPDLCISVANLLCFSSTAAFRLAKSLASVASSASSHAPDHSASVQHVATPAVIFPSGVP